MSNFTLQSKYWTFTILLDRKIKYFFLEKIQSDIKKFYFYGKGHSLHEFRWNLLLLDTGVLEIPSPPPSHIIQLFRLFVVNWIKPNNCYCLSQSNADLKQANLPLLKAFYYFHNVIMSNFDLLCGLLWSKLCLEWPKQHMRDIIWVIYSCWYVQTGKKI